MLINQTNNVEEFRKRKYFWQHELDTFQPNGLNKREVALFSYLNKSFFFIILTHNICFDTCHMARLSLHFFLKDFALSNLFNLPTYFIYFVYYNFFLFYSCCFYLFLYLFITIMSTQSYLGTKESRSQMYFKCIPRCYKFMKYVSTDTYFLICQYNQVLGVLLQLEW